LGRAEPAGAGEFIPIDRSKTKPRAEVKAFRRNQIDSRKNRFPVGKMMVTLLFVPSLEME
jgi:hypothetical protein